MPEVAAWMLVVLVLSFTLLSVSIVFSDYYGEEDE